MHDGLISPTDGRVSPGGKRVFSAFNFARAHPVPSGLIYRAMGA